MQESKLNDQIKDTSDALHKHDIAPIQQVLDWKSNVVVYEIEKNPLRHQKLYDYTDAEGNTLRNIKLEMIQSQDSKLVNYVSHAVTM